MKINAQGTTFGASITGLKQVKAKKYAGGIAGSVVTADAIGVVNKTLGVGQFIPFELSQISACRGNRLDGDSNRKICCWSLWTDAWRDGGQRKGKRH